MIAVLASGTIFRAPKASVSRGGKPFVAATVKVADGNETLFIRVMAWSDTARAELEPLSEGALVSVSGRLVSEIYTPTGGEPRVSLTVMADQALALKKPQKAKAAPQVNPGAEARTKERSTGDFADDSIPF